jgi:F-type H+-transporting ATPase subunit delta
MSNALSAKITEPYADALLNIADSTGNIDLVTSDINDILNLLSSTEGLKKYLASPTTSQEAKKELISNTIATELNSYTKQFLLVLVERNRISYLEEIAEKYLEQVFELADIKIVQVSSAISLTEEQEATLKTKITAMTKAKQVKLVTKIDSSLLGGLVVQIGTQIIDISLKGQLRQISNCLETSIL